MTTTRTIAELPNFIVLDKYDRLPSATESGIKSYQSEHDLEEELIADLRRQGYEYAPEITTPKALLRNARKQIEALNGITFLDSEWQRFCLEYLDNPGETTTDKTRKIQENHIYDFCFDNGSIRNIYLVDKEQIARNKVQVIHQFEQTGNFHNRYDVTILVNGLPLVHIELKARGKEIREAFNQVHRYSKESFNSESSLYRYIQIFVISNGTESRYFANTVKRDKDSYDFTMNWASSDNIPIKDLKDFTYTFLSKETLLSVLLTYSVFDSTDTLLIMRPYQIAATERILYKIKSAYRAGKAGSVDAGGYVWHTTGSGKTLTSFKAARLATRLDFVRKVFFVVDRKDLDYHTMAEYKRFSPDSVSGSESTRGLKRNIETDDRKIVVTTIQKLNNLMRSESDLEIYREQVVFIFDECHRSQFGEAQRNLRRKFRSYYCFGFTGTPIFPENALGDETTAGVFGALLHTYVITDAIRDEKVLKFHVEYNDVLPGVVSRPDPSGMTILREEEPDSVEGNAMLLHPDRIKAVSRHLLKVFREKTHRSGAGSGGGFNAMFAVSSVEAAKRYYDELQRQQEGATHPLTIATIFSFAPNEEQSAAGEIAEESTDPSALDSSSKEFLARVVRDYNDHFRTNFEIDSKGFENYYSDLSKRTKAGEVDLLIVVGMFLTGFDAPKLNTLFVDKRLRYHGLIQAFSRTNRIYNATKSCGNIVTFRDLEAETVSALTLFGNSRAGEVILEKSYKEYLEGFVDLLTGERRRGYLEVVDDIKRLFPDPTGITVLSEEDQKEFVKLFGEYLRLDNMLRNFDDYTTLKELDKIPPEDSEAVEAFMEEHHLTPEQVETLRLVNVLSERQEQDYRSAYNDILHKSRSTTPGEETEQPTVDWGDVTFEVELLKSLEITLDYILSLIFEYNKKQNSKEALVEEIRHIIRTGTDNRAKEGLIVDFIHATDLDEPGDASAVIRAFYEYAQEMMVREATLLIEEEHLKPQEMRRYLSNALSRGAAYRIGTDLSRALPSMSPLSPGFTKMADRVYGKAKLFVEKYRDIGSSL